MAMVEHMLGQDSGRPNGGVQDQDRGGVPHVLHVM